MLKRLQKLPQTSYKNPIASLPNSFDLVTIVTPAPFFRINFAFEIVQIRFHGNVPIFPFQVSKEKLMSTLYQTYGKSSTKDNKKNSQVSRKVSS